MHYYQKNIGNYGRDTGHLTALEHGVYNLLLDWYYLNERPITMREAVRVSRGNPEETQTVLSEFFKETPNGWIHSYADRVIAEYHAKAERNRTNGAKGGRPPKEAQAIDSADAKTQVVSSGMPKETLTHKPITNNTDKELKATVHPAAAPSRFDEFWTAYPNKKGKTPAEKRWAKDKLDSIADKIIAHVEMMKAQDDDWRRGFAPHGSTYLNQARWTDVPKTAPVRPNYGSQHAQPKLTPAERTAVNIAINNAGEIPSGYENNGNVVAEVERNLRSQVGVSLRDGRNGIGGSDVGQGIKWVNGGPGW